jgi:AraC-like DNA-binding protein
MRLGDTMNQYNQLAYHLLNSLKMHVVIYQEKELISEYHIPISLFELDHYFKTLMADFILTTQNEVGEIIIQKFQESDSVFASFKYENIHMIIGPFLDNNYQMQTVHQMKRILKIDAARTTILNQFYEDMHILLPNDLRYIYQGLSTYQGYNIDSKIMNLKTVKSNSEEFSLQENMNEIRLYVKNNYAYEARLMKCIETGDPEGLKTIINSLSTFYLPDRAPKDTLRNTKNKLIILNSISTRAAIKGGLDIYHAHELSTKLGIEIEQLKTHNDQEHMSMRILSSFAEAVRDYQTLNYPELIRQTYLYIYRNLREPFSLSDIAQFLYVSKEHLSRTFKKITQKTIQEVIMDYKIMEAKKLIEQNELSLVDISDMLNFSSSAHFSTAFKRKVGLTPKEYRSK